jgi:predicted TIM-barrel fold metal-dependent hydrolase
MKIIDIHVHVYQKISGITEGAPMTSEHHGKVKVGNDVRYFLPPSFENTNSTAETLIAHMDLCGIEKSLLMPNPLYGYHNEYFEECMTHYPDRFKGVALVDFIKGKPAMEELMHIHNNTHLFGMKIETNSTFQCAYGMRMTDSTVMCIWDYCNQSRQPIFLHMFTDQDLEDLKILSGQFPQIKFVICHMGADACFQPNYSESNYRRLLELINSHDNIYIDTSTIPMFFDEEYPFPTSVKIIEECYRAVGPEVMMWGSDYPGMLNHGTLFQLIHFVNKQCKIPQNELELIMGLNAERLFFVE